MKCSFRFCSRRKVLRHQWCWHQSMVVHSSHSYLKSGSASSHPTAGVVVNDSDYKDGLIVEVPVEQTRGPPGDSFLHPMMALNHYCYHRLYASHWSTQIFDVVVNGRTFATKDDGSGAYLIAEVAHNASSARALSSKSPPYCHFNHKHHWEHALSKSCWSVDDGWMRNYCYFTFVSCEGLIYWRKRAWWDFCFFYDLSMQHC